VADGTRAPETSPRQTRPLLLVLEDNDGIRRAMRRMLEPAGYDVIEAENGVQALQRAAEGVVFDLLISDLTLPGMPGEEIASRLRRARPELKVLYVSGHIGGGEERPITEGEAFLGKPFTRRDLLEAVSALLCGNVVQRS
jgi:CheY-like chemotaxis protein